MPKIQRPTPAEGRQPSFSPVSVMSRPLHITGKHDWITDYQKKTGQTIENFVTASGRGSASRKVAPNAIRKLIIMDFVKGKKMTDVEAGICAKTHETRPVQTSDLVDLTKPNTTTSNIKQLRDLDEHISACHGYLTRIGHHHRFKLNSLEDGLPKTEHQMGAAMPVEILHGIMHLIRDHETTSDGQKIRKLVSKLSQERESAMLKRNKLEEEIRVAIERGRALEDYCQAIEELRIKHVRPALRDLESQRLASTKKDATFNKEPQE